MLKKLITKENIFTIVFVLVAIHPIIELDYLLADKVPVRLTTIINFIIYPLLVLATFILCEKNKKKIIIFTAIYVVVLGVYFYFHCKTGAYLQDNIHLGYTFVFTVKDEFFYIVTILLPLVYIYVFNYSTINVNILSKITSALSLLISLPIIISNFFQFGYTTYLDEMKGSFFDWFSLPYNQVENHPRRYATKFFFKEGNTIGIILVIILPFMYYFFLKAKDIKKKILYGFLIATDSLAMLMLGTRVASYCTVLIPIAIIVVYIFTIFIKQETRKTSFIVFAVILTLINAGIIPFSPAYQNQQYDAADFSTLKLDDSLRSKYRTGIEEGAEGMEPFSPAWIDYYVYMFEQYKFLVGVTPSVYYMYWYDYRVDPKFWVDLIFDYELEERINARQIETIFYKYKWDLLTVPQKLTGFTWSLFMWGGINIERDFILQFYSFGYLGFPLIMGGWIVVFIYLLIKFVLGYKENKWTFFNFMLAMSISLGVVASIMSGHGFDELSSSMFIALCCAFSMKNLRGTKNELQA